jgi:hypothetical protein
MEENKKPLRELGTPLEVSPSHLLVTPHPHMTALKIQGSVERFLELRKVLKNDSRASNSVKQIV